MNRPLELLLENWDTSVGRPKFYQEVPRFPHPFGKEQSKFGILGLTISHPNNCEIQEKEWSEIFNGAYLVELREELSLGNIRPNQPRRSQSNNYVYSAKVGDVEVSLDIDLDKSRVAISVSTNRNPSKEKIKRVTYSFMEKLNMEEIEAPPHHID